VDWIYLHMIGGSDALYSAWEISSEVFGLFITQKLSSFAS